MNAGKRLLLWACLVLPVAPAVASSATQEAWLLATLRQNNPVREQLAVLGRPGQPVAIRIYRGAGLANAHGQPVAARIDGNVLALSEALVERLRTLERDSPGAGRWTLLYVLAYLAARQLGAQSTPPLSGLQLQAQAMLQALNQVLASAWEEAGRPAAPGQRRQLLQQVLAEVPYAHDLLPALHGARGAQLQMDADGFVVDAVNVQRLTVALARNGGHHDF